MAGDEATPTTPRRALAVVVLALYAAQLGWLALAAFNPRILDHVPAWAAALAAPSSLWAMLITLVLGAGAFTLVLRSGGDRARGTRLPLLVSAWSAASAAPVAFLGYLPCPGDGPPVWDAFSSTVSLFLGSFDKPFGPGEVCAYATPVGMHIARGLALLATASGATSVMLSLSRSQLDRLAARRARSLTVVTGLDDRSWELIERVSPSRSAGHRTALLAPELDPVVTERARAAGLLVVRADPDDPLGTGRGIRLERIDKVYLLAADDGWNRARVEQIQSLLAGTSRSSLLTVVARIDDPWHADEWRKRLVGDPRIAADAVGLYEATSGALIVRLRQARPRRLLIVGDAPLTLALCTELSQLGRELQFLGDEAALPEVTVLAERAGELVDDHRVLQRRFAFDPLTITTVDAEPRLAAVLEWLGDGTGCAVVITRPGTRLGTQLGIRLPALPVFEAEGDAVAVTAETPTVGSLVSFGLSLATPRADAWERASRLIHERYRRRHPGAARAVPWEELPEFYRQSNRRQLGVVRRELAALGRTWSPSSADNLTALDADPQRPIEDGLAVFDLSLDELTQLARSEHESWLAHYRDAGWSYAASRDDAQRRHPDLLEWEALPEGRREVAMTGVVDTLFQLRALGHRAVRPAPDRSAWQRYRRFGVVLASRLTEPHSWQTATGETLIGQPGDWLVNDAAGSVRTVTDASFRATHLQLDGDRWQRTSEVDARPVRPGERIDTQEGPTTAGPDGWVVRDADGNHWIVPDSKFRESYHPVGQVPSGP